jgi:hypothetical protein
MLLIPSNTTTAALRRIPFTLVDATDLTTPEDITVTGVKATLSLAGATPAASTNDIVKVNGAAGEYYVELTQAESNQTAGSYVRGWLTPPGCALSKLEAQIGPSDTFAGALTATNIADTILDRDMAAGTDSGSTTVRTVRQALRSLRNRFVVSGGTATFYKEDDSTVSHTAVLTGTPAVTEANPPGGA